MIGKRRLQSLPRMARGIIGEYRRKIDQFESRQTMSGIFQ
jgi:hypothetical protein